MCGNGLRSLGYFIYLSDGETSLKVETNSGLLPVWINAKIGTVSVTMPEFRIYELSLKLSGIPFELNYVEVGVPHLVIFVDSVQNIDIEGWGRKLRYHKHFSAGGTNVNFVEIISKDEIKIRTYERGVEAETFACGTGSTSAVLVAERLGKIKLPTVVRVRYPDNLIVKRKDNKALLDGRVRLVYQGVMVWDI